MSRIYIDTEFIEIPGQAIDLISIGAVRDDGAEYYAEFADVDMTRANPWVHENVVPYLTGDTKPRNQIAVELVEFCGMGPEFWADSPAYDWVAICWLYGAMVDRPKGWPYNCYDLRALSYQEDVAPMLWPEPQGDEHNALDDARQHHVIHEFIGAMSGAWTADELWTNCSDAESGSAANSGDLPLDEFRLREEHAYRAIHAWGHAARLLEKAGEA